jgi:hypothetical protein
MDLFSVESIVKEYRAHRDVQFAWFRMDREIPLVPYAEGIREYDPNDRYAVYAEMTLGELFSREEAEALVAYLDRIHGHEGLNRIKTRELPLPNSTLNVSAMPIGGGPDYYHLWKEPKYDLPFKVEGFFDLRCHERIDGNENIAAFSSQLIIMPSGECIRVGEEMERLLANGYTSEQVRAKIENWGRPLF